MEKVLTLQEAADHLRVSPHTLRSWVYERRIMPVRMGRLIMFSEEEIERFIERGKDEGLRQQYKSRSGHR
jgi:excisionase family DNA binding protein